MHAVPIATGCLPESGERACVPADCDATIHNGDKTFTNLINYIIAQFKSTAQGFRTKLEKVIILY